MSIFSERLKECRTQKGLTQEQLANEIGITKNSIFCYENDRREPGIDILTNLASTLDVTADYLLGLSDNRTNENDAIGKKLGLSDEAIAILEEATQALGHTDTWKSMEQLGVISIAEEYVKIEKTGNHFTELYAYLYLKSINSICTDRSLVKYIGDYLFKLIPIYMPGHDWDENLQSSDGDILLQHEEVCEMAQAVNMYKIQKRLIELAKETKGE